MGSHQSGVRLKLEYGSSPTTFKEAAAEMLRIFAFYAFAFEHRVGVWEPSRVESLFTDHF
ncbi:hypothetical protein D3Z63_22925 [Vibrio parahaemolyticus]|uniref:Uncharacterized protein n=1 Tax=Vibrio parahaemolyticus TaxID=670 RepID=A0A249W8E9_VIBPH|nr:hypothetical protein YA91_21105 [Vibrio parahaemolyticus]KIS88282.1 hypothetical protein H321_08455 [Vibrio parahaemolyticus 97-10290]KIS92838.1 hypothetical protein H338_08425 [Vibrio parahaemolyticus EN9701173]KIS95349.1 hypothetical protein H333_08440 [Vibrio parahaemolyticus 12315]KIT01321.1 hypothetical protein H324_08430 [Vibrio parahaemolyticus 846]KIT03994.1 hypothetical protein H327_08470 [Vibrio parahaemolyticus 3324]KIT10460.1 hypothetical protein H339_08445 [Vibrio parahaemolyt